MNFERDTNFQSIASSHQKTRHRAPTVLKETGQSRGCFLIEDQDNGK